MLKKILNVIVSIILCLLQVDVFIQIVQIGVSIAGHNWGNHINACLEEIFICFVISIILSTIYNLTSDGN